MISREVRLEPHSFQVPSQSPVGIPCRDIMANASNTRRNEECQRQWRWWLYTVFHGTSLLANLTVDCDM